MTIQIVVRCAAVMAIASSFASAPLAAAAQPKTPSPQTTPAKLDPRWRALTQQIDQTATPHQPASPRAFAPVVHFNLSSGALSGRVDRPEPITIKFLRGNVIVLNYSITPVFEGAGYAFADNTLGDTFYIPPVDQLDLSQAGQTLSIAIPTFATYADSERDAVVGYVLSHTLVHVQANGFTTPTLSITRDVNVSAEGIFTANLSGLMDVRPRDLGFAWVDVNSRIHLYTTFRAPFLQMEAGGTMLASPTGFISGIDITDAGNNERTHLSLIGSGTPTGFAIPLTFTLNTGDHVIVQAVGSISPTNITLPKLTVQADATGAHLFGDAPANAQVELRWFSGPITDENSSILGSLLPITRVTTSVNAQGNYSVPISLTDGGYAFVAYTTPEGHEVFAPYIKPYFRARLGTYSSDYSISTTGYEVIGQFGHYQQAITITVQGPSGYQKVERHIIGQSSGYFYDGLSVFSQPNDFAALDTGDVITVSTASGESNALTVPKFTVAADGADYAVYGSAPPNTRVRLKIPRYFRYYPLLGLAPIGAPQTVVPPYLPSIWTTDIAVNSSGIFSITLPEFAIRGENLVGEAELFLGNGNAVVRTFSSISVCRPFVNQLTIDDNTIMLGDTACANSRFQAQVWSRQGQLKWAQSDLSQSYLILTESQSPYYKPVPIASGDQIRIYQGDFVSVSTVPTLTIKANVNGNRISGVTTPNLTVTLSVETRRPIPFTDDFYSTDYYTETVANATGQFEVALGTEVILTAGSRAAARIVDGQMIVSASDVVPIVNVVPSSNEISAKLKPFAPYSISVTTAGGSPEFYESSILYANYGGDIHFPLYRSLSTGDQVKLVNPEISATFTVPALIGQINFNDALLSGVGPSNGKLALWQWNATANYYSRVISPLGSININAAGQFSLTLPPNVLAAGSNLRIALQYELSPLVRIWRDVSVNPVQWRIYLDNGTILGNMPAGSDGITLTLRTGANPTDEIAANEFYTNPINFAARFYTLPNALAGDVLTLQTNTGNFTFTLPMLTATYESEANTGVPVVRGQSEPNAQIQLILTDLIGPFPAYAVQRNTRADSQGQFGVDVSDIRPKLNSQLLLIYTDAFNNTVQRSISAVWVRLPFPIVLRN